MTVDDLPFGSGGFAMEADGNVYARTDPALSSLTVPIPPDDDDALAYLVIVALREELMHGERQKFGLMRNAHLLKRQVRQALRRYLDGDISASEAADRIVRCRAAIACAREGRRDILETIDGYLTLSSLADPDYRRKEIRRHADIQNRSVEEIEAGLDWHPKEYEKQIRDDDDDLYESLLELEADTSQTVAEAVSHVALDDPVLLSPLDSLLGIDIETTHPTDITPERLKRRFERAGTVARRLNESTDLTSLRRGEVRELIEREMETTFTHPEPLRELPLLDLPSRSLGADQVTRQGFEAVEQAQTEFDIVLNAAFQFVGNLGGAIYPSESGGARSLVNPWIEDERIDGEPYRTHWFRSLLGDTLATIVLKRAAGVDEPIACPLCALSPEGYCGGTQCECRPVRELRDPDRHNPLIEALAGYDLRFLPFHLEGRSQTYREKRVYDTANAVL